MIRLLQMMDAAAGKRMTFREMSASVDLSRKQIACAFGVFVQRGIAEQTGYTLLGDIGGYRLTKGIDGISLLDVVDCVEEFRLLPPAAGGTGAEKYAVAYDAYRNAMEKILLSELTVDNTRP